MKTLILFSTSELGGAERSLTRMAASVEGNNKQIEFLLGTLDGNGPWQKWAYELGVQPISFGKRSGRGHGRFGLIAVFALIKFIRENKVDIVYVIGLRASLILRLFKWSFRKTKLVQGVRWNPDSNFQLDRAFRFFEKWFGGLIDLYIVNSRIAARTLNRKCFTPPNKVTVIHNGIEEVPETLIPLHQRPMHVVTIANLSPRKGHLEFLEVIEKVLKKLPSAQFFFIGRDDLNGEVQEAIRFKCLSQNVHYVGFQRNVDRYLRNARLLVLPSLRDEGCPTSILEAMAYQVPVIAHLIDGIPELIDDEVNGILVPIRDKGKMVLSIVDLLRDLKKANLMALHGQTKVKNEFSLRKCLNSHITVFQNLL